MIKDRMDISLCSLDIKTKIITWSGAMNPLWIVREIKVLKKLVLIYKQLEW